MAKENAIVRKLQSVETLGCTTVICSDKTGTLTTNEMVVKEFFTFDAKTSSILNSTVTGNSYQPEGDISGIKQSETRNALGLRLFTSCMYLNNDSKLLRKDGKITRTGLPTEAALKVLVEKFAKYDDIRLDGTAEGYGNYICQDWDKIATLEFTRDRRSMSVLCVDRKTGRKSMFIKGAPDYLIKNARRGVTRDGKIENISEDVRQKLMDRVNEMAKKGLRTLALCYKDDAGELQTYDGSRTHPAHKKLVDPENYADLERDPILIGVVGIQDPARDEVPEAIAKCRKAGISVIMITGDIKETAQTIGKEIGIVRERDIPTCSFTGVEFEALKESEQDRILQNCIDTHGGLLFSRAEPKHKKILVKKLSGMNQIVAMTGDGVNDAPALKQADIGIAMGINGTEVAKEASSMVLADDNFATIVKAVEEGRAIFSNMKAFIRYMISSNIGEVVSIFTSSVLGIPDGFNSIQLLWVNLVTDGLPATALSFNPPDPEIMNKPPRSKDEAIITPWVFTRYIVIGTYVGLATVGVFIYWYCFYNWAGDGHTLVPYKLLSNWSECAGHTDVWKGFAVKNVDGLDFSKDACTYFTAGKQKASTLSLSVLVIIEMFNAMNALSEDSSLFTVGFFCNPLLLLAIASSVALHCVILYIPFFGQLFGVKPLSKNDWILVIAFSAPVCIIDEILKFISRRRNRLAQEAAEKKHQ
jgi:Ca2+-transporting ATPase